MIREKERDVEQKQADRKHMEMRMEKLKLHTNQTRKVGV